MPRNLQEKRLTPPMRYFADSLIGYERKYPLRSVELPEGIAVCERLRVPLVTLMGRAGFGALASRALALARAEIGALAWLQVNPDGTLAVTPSPDATLGQAELAEGGVVVLGRLLELLIQFIGGPLTLQIVRELWPQTLASDLENGKETKS